MRLCVFGDSFVNGTGDPERLGWVGRVTQGACDLTVYNLGVRGDTSREIRERWRGEAERRSAADEEMRLVFAFGVNDCCPDSAGNARRIARESSLGNAAAILSEASGRWATLMIGPPPIADESINDRIGDLDGALSAVAARHAIPYFTVFATLRAEATWMDEIAARDGAHPGARGYAALARLVAAWPVWRTWLGGA